MSRYSKVTSLITVALLGANSIGMTAIAIDEFQSQSMDSEETLTSGSSEIASLDVESIVNDTQTLEASSEDSIINEEDDTQTSMTADFELVENGSKFEKSVSREEDTEIEVGKWSDFVLALADESVSKITITADLTADRWAEVSHDVEVDGGGFTLKMGINAMRVAEGKTLKIHDFSHTGTSATLFTGLGNLELSGEVTGLETNGQVLSTTADTKICPNANVNINSLATKAQVTSKFFTITSANVTSTVTKLYSMSGAGEFLIDKGSKITIRDKDTHFEMSGDNPSMDSTGIGVGLLRIAGTGSQLNVENYAEMNVHNKSSTAVGLDALNAEFNASNHAKLVLSQDTGANEDYSATVRFINHGAAHYNIKDSSSMLIEHKGGKGPGLRMFGGKHIVNVDSGSDFTVKQGGTGTGILFVGDNNEFNLAGQGSSVDIDVEKNRAITGGSNTSVNASKGTYFVMRGNYPASGIVNIGSLKFNMDALAYFDFRNENATGYAIGTTGSMSSLNSNFSIWKTGSDLESKADYTWNMLDFTTSAFQNAGAATTNQESFKEEFKGMRNYARITANNQAASIRELRVPTDSDKSIYARALIPQAKGEDERGAYEGEVVAEATVYDGNDEEQFKIYGKSQASNYKVYDDEEKNGIIRFDVPEEKLEDGFLPIGWKVKIDKGNSGESIELGEGSEIPSENITKDIKVVRDVTPPKEETFVANKNSIAAGTKTLKGKASEKGKVTVYTADKSQKSESVETDSEGNFELPMIDGLEGGDLIYVAANDTSGPISDDVALPPATNDGTGNEQPNEGFKYHDREFVPATEIMLVDGDITLESAPSVIDFGKNAISRNELNLKANFDKGLIVSDTRVDGFRQEWALSLKVTELLQNPDKDYDLTPGLSYIDRDKEEKSLSTAEIIVEQTINEEQGSLDLSQEWSNDEGFRLNVPTEKQKADSFSGELGWTLQKSVINKEED